MSMKFNDPLSTPFSKYSLPLSGGVKAYQKGLRSFSHSSICSVNTCLALGPITYSPEQLPVSLYKGSGLAGHYLTGAASSSMHML